MLTRVLLTLTLVFAHAGFAAAQFGGGGTLVQGGGFVAQPHGVAGGMGSNAGAPLHVMLLQDGSQVVGDDFTSDDPISGSLFGNYRVDIGFEYLRPHYSNQATTLVVPPNAAAAFPVRGSLGDVTHDFAFIPRFGIEYNFPNTSGLGVAASGKLFTIQGDIRRTITNGTTTGVLNAENTLSIGSANVLEGLIRCDLSKREHCQGTFLENLTLLGTIGGRYGYVRQAFTASLVSGPNTTSLTATQDFTGFGITSSIGTLYLMGEKKRLGLYTLSRGSILSGNNNRTSTFSTVVVNGDGTSSGQATEKLSKLISVGEFEVGVSWGLPLRRNAAAAAAAGVPLPPLLWCRTGAVAQVWGGLGLPNPPVNSTLQGGTFADNALVLYGFTIQAGLNF